MLNQPPRPPGTTYCLEGYYAYATRTPGGQARVGRTLGTVDGGSTWFNVAGDVFYDLILETAPPVQILGVVPAAGEQGSTLDVTLNGAGFRDGATVSFGPDITVNTLTFVGAAELRANISIPCSGASANRSIDVTVTNPEVLFPNVSRVFTVTPSLTDTDCDGTQNAQDCAPGDATAFALPAEVTGLRFEPDDSTLAFDSAEAALTSAPTPANKSAEVSTKSPPAAGRLRREACNVSGSMGRLRPVRQGKPV